MKRTVEIDLQFQDVIAGPPIPQGQLWTQACSNDEITILSWKEQWIRQMKENKEHFGSFAAMGIGTLFNKHKHQPAIC